METMQRLPSGADGLGTDYEYKIAALWATRARRQGYRFKMFGNAEATLPLDDLVVRVTHPVDALVCAQLKHKKGKTLSMQSFRESKDFGLLKYFPFCEKIHELHASRQRGDVLSGDDALLSETPPDQVWFVLFTSAEVDEFIKASSGKELLFPWEDVLNSVPGESSFSLHSGHTKIWNLWKNIKKKKPSSGSLFQQNFLPHLKVFSNQPLADDVDALLTEEVNKIFGGPLPDADQLTEQLLKRFKVWARDSLGRCVSESSGELEQVIAEELRRRARKGAGGGIFRFREEQCVALRDAMNAPGALRACVSDVPAGHRAVKVLQVLDDHFKGDWAYVDDKILKEYPLGALKAVCSVCKVLVVDVVKGEMNVFRLVAAVEKNTKVVEMCSDCKEDSLLDAKSVLQDDWTLNHLQEEFQNKMLKTHIRFQGQDMPLGDLEAAWPRLRSEVDGGLLSALANGEAAMGAALDAAVGAQGNVPRTLLHHCALKPAVLSQIDPQTDHLVLSGFSPSAQKEATGLSIQMSKPNWTVLDNNGGYLAVNLEQAFMQACLANRGRNIHWVHKAGESLTWRATIGLPDSMLPHVRSLGGSCPPARGPTCEHERRAEADVAAWGAHEFLLLGEPGAGKTHFLRRAAAEARGRAAARWTVVVDLLAHREMLRDMRDRRGMDVEDVLELLAAAAARGGADGDTATPLTPAARRCLRACLLETGAVAVAFDGVDEVAPSDSVTVLRLLKLLLRATKAERVWVAAREEVGESLSKVLRCSPSRLLPLSRWQQENFLTAQWSSMLVASAEEVRRLARQIVGAFSRLPGRRAERVRLWLTIGLPAAVTKEITNILHRDQENAPHTASESDLKEMNLNMIAKCHQAVTSVMQRRGGTIVLLNMPPFLPFVEEVLGELLESLVSEERWKALANTLKINLGEIASDIVDSFGDGVRRGSLLGAPLHLLMTAEAFAPEAAGALESGGNLLQGDVSQPDLFGRFVRLKKEYFVKKHGLTLGNADNTNVKDAAEEMFTRLHQSHAMSMWSVDFPESDRRQFFEAAEETKQYLAKEKNGIVWQLENGEITFAHFTLVEYFVASWMVDNRGNAVPFIRSAFHQSSGSAVPFFLDLMLSERRRVHRAVLHDDLMLSERRRVHRAVLHDDLSALEAALAQKGAADSLDEGGRSPLHLAAAHGRLEALDRLLAAGGRVGAPDSLLCWTPLQYADAAVELEVVERLLRAGADAKELQNIVSSAASEPSISLQMAAKDLYKVTSHLLTTRARYDIINGFGVQLTEGDPGKSYSQRDTQSGHFYGITSIFVAAQNNSMKVTEMLLKDGANVNMQNLNMGTPLHAVAEIGNADMVELLLAYNANIQSKNIAGNTPLHIAAFKGHCEVVKKLIDAGAKLNARDNEHKTPLHSAAYGGHYQIVETLADAGAKVNAHAIGETTPLHLAALKGHWQVVEKLLDAGAVVDARSSIQGTAIHTAALKGNRRDVEKLLLQGGYGIGYETPLTVAAFAGHLKVVEVLVREGAQLNARFSIFGDTPIFGAVALGHAGIVEILLRAGARLDIYDKFGRSPQQLAVENGNRDVAWILWAAVAGPAIRRLLQVALQR